MIQWFMLLDLVSDFRQIKTKFNSIIYMQVILTLAFILFIVGVVYKYRKALFFIFLSCLAFVFLFSFLFISSGSNPRSIYENLGVSIIFFIISSLIFVIVKILFSTIKSISQDDREYANNKKLLYKFLLKWSIIYLIFGYVLEFLLTLLINEDVAKGIKLAIGSRLFIATILIYKLIQWTNEVKNRA